MKGKIKCKKVWAVLLTLALSLQAAAAPAVPAAAADESGNPDPNFHIYIAFGQSNMEGHEPMTDADKIVDDNFLMMQTADGMQTEDGTPKEVGQWYPAVPKLANPNTVGVGVCDFFGRNILELKQETNPDVKVGVIVVAIGGVGIKFFDKDVCKEEIAKSDGWQQDIANKNYGGSPYQRIVDMANLAKKDGVIKGIILHQGETDAYQSYWTGEVEKIYNDLIADIGLSDNVPLIAGECLRSFSGANQNVGQNQNINKLPDINSNFHVVSSENLEGVDQWHFTHESYEEFGRRYAEKMLEVEPQYTWEDPVYEWSADNTTVKASRTCKELPFYVEEETVNVKKTETPATKEAAGKIEYVSDDFKNPAFTKQTKTETIPPLTDTSQPSQPAPTAPSAPSAAAPAGNNTPPAAADNQAQTAEKILKLSAVKCKKNSKKITGKVSEKGATVKVKVGKKAAVKAKVKGKKFTLKLSYKLKKKTKVTITATKKDYKQAKKTYTVK